MLAVRRCQRYYRAWVLPLLLAPFLSAALIGCYGPPRCEAVSLPSAIPTLFFASGRVYLFSPGTSSLYALRASDGKGLWHAQGTFQAGDPDQLYLSLGQQRAPLLEALRASDGTVVWRTRQAVPFRPLGVLDGSVYLYEFAQNALVALNATDGSQRWKVEGPQLDTGADGAGNLSIQVVDGVVYARSAVGVLSAFREEDGSLLWSRHLPGPFESRSSWVVVQGMIYLSDTGGLYALRASDGQALWQGDPASFALGPGGSVLYALSRQRLSVLRASDGHVLWTRAESDMSAGGGLIALQLIDGTLYAGALSGKFLPDGSSSTNYYWSVNALRASDGQPLWQYEGKDGILAVAGVNGTAYLFDYGPTAQSSATLAALHASDGQPLWHSAIKQANGMIFADDAFYTGYGGNDQTSGCTATGPVVVAKFQPSDGRQLWRFQS